MVGALRAVIDLGRSGPAYILYDNTPSLGIWISIFDILILFQAFADAQIVLGQLWIHAARVSFRLAQIRIELAHAIGANGVGDLHGRVIVQIGLQRDP